MKALTIALACVSVLSAYVVGIAVGFKTGINPTDILYSGKGGNYEDGFNHARELLAESGFFPATTGKVTSLSGTVKSVDDTGFVITVSGRIHPNPLDPQGPAERRIEISKNTTITSRIRLSIDEMDAANKKFQEDMRAGRPSVPPELMREETRSLSDIKSGMVVTVTSDDDVSVAPTIKATKIALYENAAVPANPVGTPPPTAP